MNLVGHTGSLGCATLLNPILGLARRPVAQRILGVASVLGSAWAYKGFLAETIRL